MPKFKPPKVPKGRIYFVKSKGWKIKGWAGYSPTFMKAVKRYKDVLRRTKGLKQIKPEVLGAKFIIERLGGIGGATRRILLGTYKRDLKRAQREYIYMLEKRREAIIKARQQKKLQQFGFPRLKRYELPYAFRK